jgi:hypothetical protein
MKSFVFESLDDLSEAKKKKWIIKEDIGDVLKGKDLNPEELKQYRDNIGLKLDVYDIIKLEYFVQTAMQKIKEFDEKVPGGHWEEYKNAANELNKVLRQARENNLEFISKSRE